jgi:hypothetical protein
MLLPTSVCAIDSFQRLTDCLLNAYILNLFYVKFKIFRLLVLCSVISLKFNIVLTHSKHYMISKIILGMGNPSSFKTIMRIIIIMNTLFHKSSIIKNTCLISELQ